MSIPNLPKIREAIVEQFTLEAYAAAYNLEKVELDIFYSDNVTGDIRQKLNADSGQHFAKILSDHFAEADELETAKEGIVGLRQKMEQAASRGRRTCRENEKTVK